MRIEIVENDFQPVTKSAEPHRFAELVVDEASVVTQPAILSADEAGNGVGVVVVKNLGDGRPVRVPEAVLKSFAVSDGADVWDALRDLINVCRLAVTTFKDDEEAYWDYHPNTIKGDHVLMVSWWDDPFSGEAKAYHCSYEKDGETFKVSKLVELQLKFVEVSGETAAKNAEPSLETPAAAAAEPQVVATEVPVEANAEVAPEDPVAASNETAPEPEAPVAGAAAAPEAVVVSTKELLPAAGEVVLSEKTIAEAVEKVLAANTAQLMEKFEKRLAELRPVPVPAPSSNASAAADIQPDAAPTYSNTNKNAGQRKVNLATNPARGLFTGFAC